MARFSSLGLFGIFGRSSDLRELDRAFRLVDLHPRLVPEAVKLTLVNLLKDQAIGSESASQAYRSAAEIVAYCMLGAEGFASANGAQFARKVEDRIEKALESGTNLDARFVLLTLHAKVAQPSVIHAFKLESAED
jgi:hypothetical protein